MKKSSPWLSVCACLVTDLCIFLATFGPGTETFFMCAVSVRISIVLILILSQKSNASSSYGMEIG